MHDSELSPAPQLVDLKELAEAFRASGTTRACLPMTETRLRIN